MIQGVSFIVFIVSLSCFFALLLAKLCSKVWGEECFLLRHGWDCHDGFLWSFEGGELMGKSDALTLLKSYLATPKKDKP
jgi:hypothetical protein